MADDHGTSGGGFDGPFADQIRDLAVQIRERAADLRICEVLDMWDWGATDVDGTGDNTPAALDGARKDRAEGYQEQTGVILGAEFDYVIELFEKYTAVSAQGAYDAVFAELQRAALELEAPSLTTDLGDVRRKLGEHAWTGDAANAFRDNYLGSLEQVASSQVQLIWAVRHVLEGHRKVELAAHEGARNIAAATLSALDAAIGVKASGVDAAAVLSVVGASLAVAAVFVPGTQGVSLGLAILGAAKEVTGAGLQFAAGPEPEKVEQVIKGSTVDEIMLNMSLAMVSLQSAVVGEEAALIGTVNGDLDLLAASPDSKQASLLVFPRPSLISSNPSDKEWEHRG